MKWLHKIKCATYNRMYFLSGLFDWGRAYVVDIAQLVRAPDCDSGGRRFESGYPPHFFTLTVTLGCRQAVRHQTLTLTFVGSNPAIPATFYTIR